jgi:hypothetical protein
MLHTVTVDLSGDLITDTEAEMRMAWPGNRPLRGQRRDQTTARGPAAQEGLASSVTRWQRPALQRSARRSPR